MDVNFDLMKNAFPLLVAGAGITIEITALSVFFGMLIGIVVALVRLSDFKILRWLGNVYVDFIRGTPLLIQIRGDFRLLHQQRRLCGGSVPGRHPVY